MITIKEEFVGCDKYVQALELGGAEAIVMWLAMKRYAAANLTDGFVPDEKIEKLAGVPKRPRKALKALVECGELTPDGSRGDGLVDQVERGWLLHDYDDHANSSDEERLRKERARVKKAAQRAAKRAELDALLASRGHGGDSPGIRPGDVAGTVPGTVPGTGKPGHSGERPPAPVRTHAPSPTQPNPDPVAVAPGAAAAARPQNRDQALALPIAERAAFVERDKHLADWVEPHTWPEVLAIAAALHDASEAPGQVRLAPYARDAGVRALVTLFAAKYEQAELELVARGIVGRTWWAEGGRKGLGALTPEVVRRELSERPSGTVLRAQSIAERQAAEFERQAADARARGVESHEGPAVTDPAELDRIFEGVG